jgi:tetratricopeptide (TPR) repeat protein
VFSGGYRLDAAVAVCSDTADPDDVAKRLARLVDKSLVQMESDDGNRYALAETVRAYALERLDEHGDGVRDKHAAHYAAFAEQAETELTGPQQAVWVARIQKEYLNLRAAYERGLDAGSPAVATRVAVGLWRYWRNRGQLREGRDWLDRLLGTALPDDARARVLHAAAVLAAAQDDHEGALVLARESHERAVAAGDRRTSAQAGNALGIALMAGGRHAEARAVFADCLATWQRLDDPLGTAMAHGNLTMVALRLGDVDTASSHAAECLRLERAQGNTRGIMLALLCLGEISISRGDGTASRHLTEALAASRDIGDVFGEAMALHQLGLAALAAGDLPGAARQVAAALTLRRDLGDREDLCTSLETLAELIADDEPELAARMVGAAEGVRLRHRLPLAPEASAQRDSIVAALWQAIGADSLEADRVTGLHADLDTVVDEVVDVVERRYCGSGH